MSNRYKEGYLLALGELEELRRRAIAVTRMWDTLGQCQDEFLPEDPAASGELQDCLDIAIGDLMSLVDREQWDRRLMQMREAGAPSRRGVVETR